jgi:hypothetical protein
VTFDDVKVEDLLLDTMEDGQLHRLRKDITGAGGARRDSQRNGGRGAERGAKRGAGGHDGPVTGGVRVRYTGSQSQRLHGPLRYV